MAQLTNKSTNKDLDFYVKECAHTMGLRDKVDMNNSSAILSYVLKELIKFKKNDL